MVVFNYALSDGGVSVGQTATGQIATLYGGGSAIGNPMSLSPAPVAYYPLGDQDAFNGADYLTPNASLKDFVFDFSLVNNNSINLGNSAILAPRTNTFTFSAWINPNNWTATYSVVYANPTTNGIWIGKLNSSGFVLRASSDANYLTHTLPTAGEWTHIVITRDASNLTTLYYNGVSQTTATVTKDFIEGTTYIGSDNFNNEFNGFISNVQVFNTALSATGSNSIETLYNNGSPLTSMSGFTSLQGWWKLDASATYDSSTTTWSIPDDSSNSNDGTSSGMTQSALQQSDLSFKTSISPYALSFSGSGDYIDLNSDITLTGNKSVSFWVNFTSTIAGVVFGGASSNYYPYIDATSIYIRAGGALSTFAHGGLTAGVWYNICITGDGTNATAYLNGSSLGTQTDKGFTFKLINAEGAGYYGVDGKLSNCAIWNAALTSSQVKEIYNEGVPSNLNNHSAYSNLVSWWQLGSNSSFNTNWTVLDEKGSNNGTSVNMTEVDIVDGVGSYANGLSSGMGGDEVIGDAPYSSSNSLSVNMDVLDRTEDTPS